MKTGKAILPILLDLVVPIVGYFLLHGLGFADFWALTVSGAATGVVTAVNTVRRRKLDGLGLLVVIELALSIALLFTTRDPRIVLLKPAFYTTIGGLFALATCVLGRPLVHETGKPFASKGDPRRAAAYDAAWRDSARFRRVLTEITVAWGIGFLLESAARVTIVLHYPPSQINDSLLLSQLPSVLLLVLAIAYTRLRVRTIRPIVDEFMASATPTSHFSHGRTDG